MYYMEVQISMGRGKRHGSLAPRKSFDILALYKSDYYYYYCPSHSKALEVLLRCTQKRLNRSRCRLLLTLSGSRNHALEGVNIGRNHLQSGTVRSRRCGRLSKTFDHLTPVNYKSSTQYSHCEKITADAHLAVRI